MSKVIHEEDADEAASAPPCEPRDALVSTTEVIDPIPVEDTPLVGEMRGEEQENAQDGKTDWRYRIGFSHVYDRRLDRKVR